MFFPPINNFENETEAQEAAQKELLNILNNKSFLVPDKFSSLIADFRKKQSDYNNEINVSIKNHVENIRLSTKFLGESQQSLEKAKEEYQNINKYWENSLEFHNDMDIYEKILIYRRNISNFLDQIKYFLNISSQIQKLEELFTESEENFDYIHYKLLALCELRDNVISKMSENQTKTEDLKKIFKEFEVLESFESKFYATIFQSITNARTLAKKNPVQLIKMVKILENGDSLLENEGKPLKFRAKCLEVIRISIDKRFDEELKGSKNINETLEKLQFTVSDLIEVLDNVVKCFPKKYDIFKVYEEGYKNNIEKRVLPFLDDEDKIKESFGALIALLKWMDSYEALMIKAGVSLEESVYVFLKSKVKSYMPMFLDHVKKLLGEYCERAVLKDRAEMQKLEAIAQMLKEKKELVSNFAEDIFHFANQQLSLLVGKLNGELYIELIRIMTYEINCVQENEKNYLRNNLDPPEENYSIVCPMFKVVLFINNFWKCLQYSNETKQYCLKFSEETLQERVEKIFINDLNKGLQNSINEFFSLILPFVFLEIEIQILPILFTPRWFEEDLFESAIITLEDYFQELKSTIASPIYFNRIAKICFEKLFSLYFDFFLNSSQICFNCCPGFFSEDVSRVLEKFMNSNEKNNQENEKKNKKKDKEKDKQKALKQQSFMLVFTNKEKMIEKIKKEKNFFVDKANEKYLNIIGKTSIEKLDKMFKVLIDMMKMTKSDLESSFSHINECFQSKGIYMVESVMFIREDVDAEFKKEILRKYQEFLNKQANK